MRAVLEHRRQAQDAVEEQERKIAQLTALQADLKSKLADLMENGGEEDEEPDEEPEEEVEQQIAEADMGDDDERETLAERVLTMLATKTDECQQLAAVVEEARSAGMDPSNPRLQQAEHNLATRYQEIKELAAFAHRLGLTDEDIAEEEEEEEEAGGGGGTLMPYQTDEDAAADREALDKVQRLEHELSRCVTELQAVDANASESVKSHPAFRKMRAAVVSKVEALHAELAEARSAYARKAEASSYGRGALMAKESEADEQEEEVDLSPMLRAALDKLWQRPYDCRIFTLQLLQSLAQLDDQSLCMMTSCFARYLENHSVPDQ